jgi:hypothetical protein
VTFHFPVFRYFLRLIRQAETKNDDRESPCRRITITKAAAAINTNDACKGRKGVLWGEVLQTSHGLGSAVKIAERYWLRAIYHKRPITGQVC